MATLRYSDGPVTVTLDGGLEQLVRQALDVVAGETVRLMEAAAEDVARAARATWYDPAQGGVTRRTGRSGDIEVVTTISATEVRVSIGSTDLAKAKYVHQPGRLATTTVEITADAYAQAKRSGGIPAALVFHARRDADGVVAGRYYRRVHSPLASGGAYLLPKLIRTPMRARIKAITPDLGQAIIARMGKK